MIWVFTIICAEHDEDNLRISKHFKSPKSGPDPTRKPLQCKVMLFLPNQRAKNELCLNLLRKKFITGLGAVFIASNIFWEVT